MKAIIYSCGSQTNSRGTERSVILDAATIRKAWFRQGNHRLLDWDSYYDCLWWSRQDWTSVRAVDVYPYAFTDCNNNDSDCIQRHIEVF
jgi:hypothetical protein